MITRKIEHLNMLSQIKILRFGTVILFYVAFTFRCLIVTTTLFSFLDVLWLFYCICTMHWDQKVRLAWLKSWGLFWVLTQTLTDMRWLYRCFKVLSILISWIELFYFMTRIFTTPRSHIDDKSFIGKKHKSLIVERTLHVYCIESERSTNLKLY